MVFNVHVTVLLSWASSSSFCFILSSLLFVFSLSLLCLLLSISRLTPLFWNSILPFSYIPLFTVKKRRAKKEKERQQDRARKWETSFLHLFLRRRFFSVPFLFDLFPICMEQQAVQEHVCIPESCVTWKKQEVQYEPTVGLTGKSKRCTRGRTATRRTLPRRSEGYCLWWSGMGQKRSKESEKATRYVTRH